MTKDKIREHILFLMEGLHSGNIDVFYRLYSPEDRNIPVNEVLLKMNRKQLNWVRVQVEHALQRKLREM